MGRIVKTIRPWALQIFPTAPRQSMDGMGRSAGIGMGWKWNTLGPNPQIVGGIPKDRSAENVYVDQRNFVRKPRIIGRRKGQNARAGLGLWDPRVPTQPWHEPIDPQAPYNVGEGRSYMMGGHRRKGIYPTMKPVPSVGYHRIGTESMTEARLQRRAAEARRWRAAKRREGLGLWDPRVSGQHWVEPTNPNRPYVEGRYGGKAQSTPFIKGLAGLGGLLDDIGKGLKESFSKTAEGLNRAAGPAARIKGWLDKGRSLAVRCTYMNDRPQVMIQTIGEEMYDARLVPRDILPADILRQVDYWNKRCFEPKEAARGIQRSKRTRAEIEAFRKKQAKKPKKGYWDFFAEEAGKKAEWAGEAATSAATGIATTVAQTAGSAGLGLIRGMWPLLLAVGGGGLLWVFAKRKTQQYAETGRLTTA